MTVSTVILSTLSDAEALMEFGEQVSATWKIELAKYLLLQYPNTDIEISTDEFLNHIKNFSKQ